MPFPKFEFSELPPAKVANLLNGKDFCPPGQDSTPLADPANPLLNPAKPAKDENPAPGGLSANPLLCQHGSPSSDPADP